MTPWPSTKHTVMDVRVSRKGLGVPVCKKLPGRVVLYERKGRSAESKVMKTSLSAGQASKILIPF